jgi:hypothetical protein
VFLKDGMLAVIRTAITAMEKLRKEATDNQALMPERHFA